MMTALATVMAVQKRKQNYQVKVSCEQQTSCKACQSQKSCGTGIVSKALGSKSHHWVLNCKQPLSVGQVIEIGLPEKNFIQSALAVYLLPLFCMMLGSLVGQIWLRPWLGFSQAGSGEGVVIAMFFLSGLLGIWLSKPITRYLEQQASSRVSLIRVLGQPVESASFKSL